MTPFASSQRGMLREVFDDTGRFVPRASLDHHVVVLRGRVRVIDLRSERTLDAVGLDDQVSTIRAPDVWAAGQRLSAAAHRHYGDRPHGLVYRSRTTQSSNLNLAFPAAAPFDARSLGPLRGRSELLTAAVLGDGFTVDDG